MFRRRRFFTGEVGRGAADHLSDICWLTPAGTEMTDDDWAAGFAKSLTVFLNGEAITEPDPRGERVSDDSFLLLLNAAEHRPGLRHPAAGYGDRWEPELDTADPQPPPGESAVVKAGDVLTLTSRSLRLLRRA